MIVSKKNITLADIAERAEVAVKTASKAFRGDPSVISYIKKRVLDEARKVNYTPNTLAQAMRTKKLNLVSFHIAELGNPFYGQLFAKVAFKLGEKGIMVVPCDGVDKFNEANQNAFACATILTDAYLDKVQNVIQTGPLVTINCYDPENSLSPGVYIDFEWAYKEIMQKVLDAGRNKIIFLSPSEQEFKANLRKFRHIEDVLKKNDRNFEDIGKNYITTGKEVAELALAKKLDTVFCTNDIYAIKVMLEARKHGINVPKDLLVIGCDGTFYEESLWTVSVDLDLLSKMTVDLLIKVLHDSQHPQQIRYKPELITPEI